VSPGNNATFSFNVTAPSTAGTYNFQWKMVQDGVEWFGAQSTNVAVKVGLNDAGFASHSVPPVMTPGQSYPVTVTMQNTGGKTWTAGTFHGLGSQNPQDNTTWGGNRVTLPGTTAPGANAAFSFNVTAPTTPGTYNFQWKMVQDGLEWFGALSTNAAIKVGLDNAALVSQSVPSTMAAGQSYAVSVTMQNTGSTTWAAGTVGIGSQNAQGNTTWGPSKVNLASPVAPSAQTTFNFNVTAPATPGSYNFQWKMVEGTNGWFGAQSTNVAVNVTAGSPAANVYFIHTDHLNTPRLVANSSGAAVWRWDQQEPFGVNVPDENPSALGQFEFPLRFPGQYADKESNLHYNFFRDYDPVTGRYVQSDPIGLVGGLNTYAYVGGNPLLFIDPKGLATICAGNAPAVFNPSDFPECQASLIGSGAETDVAVSEKELDSKFLTYRYRDPQPGAGPNLTALAPRGLGRRPPVKPEVTVAWYKVYLKLIEETSTFTTRSWVKYHLSCQRLGKCGRPILQWDLDLTYCGPATSSSTSSKGWREQEQYLGRYSIDWYVP
jgi:RHS repeat-associated protein